MSDQGSGAGQTSHGSQPITNKALIALCLGALGVVFGDIGTSPLYTMSEIFFGHGGLQRTPQHIVGATSLIVWGLMLVVSVKYVSFVLRADHDGEGGVFALHALLSGGNSRWIYAIRAALILAAGLLYGDGIITPAISVLSAVEGLKVVTHTFEPFVIPITVGIIVALFSVQRKGTEKMGPGSDRLSWHGSSRWRRSASVGFLGRAAWGFWLHSTPGRHSSFCRIAGFTERCWP